MVSTHRSVVGLKGLIDVPYLKTMSAQCPSSTEKVVRASKTRCGHKVGVSC